MVEVHRGAPADAITVQEPSAMRSTSAVCLPSPARCIERRIAFAGVDNGYLRFDHVLVPHTAMLSRFAKVYLPR